MTFSTLMVHLDLEHSNDARLQIAGDLAEQFDAKLIGVAAASPQPTHYAGGDFAQGLVANERSEIKKKIAEAEDRFPSAVRQRARDVEWRSAMERPLEYVTREARAADLIITGVNRDGLLLNQLRQLDPSDLVMRVGRPIFVIPPEAEYLKLKRGLVAWKDTREARRAVYDTLPLLHKAKEVNVVEVILHDGGDRDAAQGRVNDVAAWLRRHSILAYGTVLCASDEEDQIEQLAIWRGFSGGWGLWPYAVARMGVRRLYSQPANSFSPLCVTRTLMRARRTFRFSQYLIMDLN